MTEPDSATEAKEPPRPHIVLRFFRLFSDLLTPKNITLLAGLLLVAVTSLFGGWEAVAADETEIPEFEAGDVVPVAPFEVTSYEVFWADDLAPLTSAWQDTTFLAMRINLAQTTQQVIYTYILSEAVTARIPGVELSPQEGLWSNSNVTDGSLGRPRVYRAVDFNMSRSIQPNLSQEYWLVWELPPETERVPELVFEFYSHTWRQSALDRGYAWFDRTLVATQVTQVAAAGDVMAHVAPSHVAPSHDGESHGGVEN